MRGDTIGPRQADRRLVECLLHARANGRASRLGVNEYQRPGKPPHLLRKRILDRSLCEMGAREIVDEKSSEMLPAFPPHGVRNSGIPEGSGSRL